MPRPHIEICGGIASGKTTLAKVLRRLGAPAVLEDFRKNPFWRAFYKDPRGFAFETEVTFALLHFHLLKAHALSACVFDFSLVLDRAYVDVTLSGRQRAAFLSVLSEIKTQIGPPALVIQLICSPAEELRRIHRRRRQPEQIIQAAYLEKLNGAIEEQVRRARKQTRIIKINSEKYNFASDKEVQEEIGLRISRLAPYLQNARR